MKNKLGIVYNGLNSEYNIVEVENNYIFLEGKYNDETLIFNTETNELIMPDRNYKYIVVDDYNYDIIYELKEYDYYIGNNKTTKENYIKEKNELTKNRINHCIMVEYLSYCIKETLKITAP